jgi:hypothetical protein
VKGYLHFILEGNKPNDGMSCELPSVDTLVVTYTHKKEMPFNVQIRIFKNFNKIPEADKKTPLK